MKNHLLYVTEFRDWESSLRILMDSANFADMPDPNHKILIKPNLVEASEPPITTPVAMIACLIDYIRDKCPQNEIIIGEGTGAMQYNTHEVFEKLGYSEMASSKSVKLIDLNEEPLVRLSKSCCARWPEMYLPSIVMENFIISVPVLKAHSLSEVTLTMKNMLGAAPPAHYNAGSWKKSVFHSRIHEAIFDLNRYRMPDFSVLDATIGMQEAHLWGPVCDPPPNILAASCDPVAIDAFGAKTLKRNWKNIGHIRMADGVLGVAEAREMVLTRFFREISVP